MGKKSSNKYIALKRKEEKKIHHDIKILIPVVLFTILFLLGTSYAVFILNLKGEKELSMQSGTLAIQFQDQNVIELKNTYPMSDSRGMKTASYQFSIENKGDIKAVYDISLEEDENNTLDYKSLRYAIKRGDGEWSNPKNLDSLLLESNSEIDAKEKNVYELKLWLDENAGNEAQGKTFRARVVVSSTQSNGSTIDVVPPVIKLAGEMSVSIEQNAEYSDLGVESVSDNKDTLEKEKVEISYEYYDGKTTNKVESIDTSKLGVYYIYYKVKDKSNNEGVVVRSLNIYKIDTTPPVITLNGKDNIHLYTIDTYQEQGAVAEDAEEGNLNSRIVTIGTVNTKKIGNYIVKYLVTDQSGNTTSIVRIVQVTKSLLSVIAFDENHLVGGTIDKSDSEQTFITGESPNNYVWYSGKLWRVVSKDPSDHSVKLVTQWNISAISYNLNENNRSAFHNSYMEEWLNDTSVDGFLGNLREPEKFIKMNSKWNTTQTMGITKPSKITIVEDAVGLLNIYEYTMSYKNTTDSNGYLNNHLVWWTLTPYNASYIRYVTRYGTSIDSTVNNDMSSNGFPVFSYGVRPSINLKSTIEIASGSGTEEDPYRLKGDADIPKEGTLLNTRYSGEYVKFGAGENHLYQIISKETGGVKLASVEPLKSNGNYLRKAFNKDASKTAYMPNDSTYETAYFLNHDYLDVANGYLTEKQLSMIENATWYYGTVTYNDSYKLSKYTTIAATTLTNAKVNTKVGLLRMGEQFSSITFINDGNFYWLLTPYEDTYGVRFAHIYGLTSAGMGGNGGVRPSVHLKQSIKITGGDGTFASPFTISE